MKSQFLSKAKTLIDIRTRVKLFQIPELIIFDVSTYLSSPSKVIEQIVNTFNGRLLVIRSSAFGEDGLSGSLAGEYESVLNVSSRDKISITSAIKTVIDSYKRNASSTPNDEFIVQEMVLNSSMSGVVFTHDLNTGAPYYVINYDDISGLTDTVTSGDGEYANRTLYIHRGALQSLRSERFQRLLQAIQELEILMNSQFLDIEFALDQDFTPYLFQVRAITTQPNWNRAVAKRINASLQGIQSFVKTRFQPVTGIYGSTTVLGQMPDWNPAEMIGRAPRALAYSLYKTLITDHAWRSARKIMGYAVPIGQPLMISLAGQPFIDTRLSFHSYLPEQLSSSIGEKLVDTWINNLKLNPELHDKIEFDIAITTYSFDIDSKIAILIGDALNEREKNEFKEALRSQTHELLTGSNNGSLSKALLQIDELASKQSKTYKTNKITDLYTMIDDCINFGTVPFSILARHGFIARTILLSLKTCGILSDDDIHAIQSGVHTVASTLVDDMRRLQLGEISRDVFMANYGHLRPGTYDILSLRYDQMSDLGINDTNIIPEHETRKFELSNEQKIKIDNLLSNEGFKELDSDKLLDYIQSATAGREYGKFVFTRSVSNMLEIISEYGESHGLSREEMSHISIDHLLDVLSKSKEGSIEECLRLIADEEAEHHDISVAIRLPQVLFDEAGVHVVPFQVSHPNFITHKKITANCVNLFVGQTVQDLAGKIVIIENADPGFDWIFSQKIGGLITKYGGANSHMAIRCAEFGIPAAIGCGEQRFEVFIKSNQILLDCATGLINPLH